MNQSKSHHNLGEVSTLADDSVSCPICQQEFWGYSKIIFCSCGWTWIQEEHSQSHSDAGVKQAAAVPANPRGEELGVVICLSLPRETRH